MTDLEKNVVPQLNEEGAEKVLNSPSHTMVDQKLWDYMTEAMNLAKK